jgi:hypothetical protein
MNYCLLLNTLSEFKDLFAPNLLFKFQLALDGKRNFKRIFV